MSAKPETPRWVPRAVVLAIHADQMRQHGGALGLRDEGLLESALARPRNRWGYEHDADPATLAAGYGFGLARNHPFIDGNKRVAFQVMLVYLGLNGHRITATEPEVVTLMMGVASGTIDESALGNWLRDHIQTRD
jgi:death on curing protein